MTESVRFAAFICLAVAWLACLLFFAGYSIGKDRGCSQVGSVVRTDSHVYRVCR